MTDDTANQPEPETKQPEALAPDLESLAPDPPRVNERALAAEGASAPPVGLSASLASASPSGGTIVKAQDGTELRTLGGRWFRVDSGAELRDRHGLTFTPGVHLAIDGTPRISQQGMLCGVGGRNAGKRARERMAILTGTIEPTIAGASLPPMTSILAGPAPAQPGPAPSPQNQTPFQSSAPPPLSSNVPGAPPMPTQRTGIGSAENDKQAEALAVVLVETVSGVASMAVGPYAAATKTERDSMVSAWQTYLRTVDCSYVPPWALPILASGPYAIRVATDPRFAEKFQKPQHAPDPMRESPPPTVASSEASHAAPAPDPFARLVNLD